MRLSQMLRNWKYQQDKQTHFLLRECVLWYLLKIGWHRDNSDKEACVVVYYMFWFHEGRSRSLCYIEIYRNLSGKRHLNLYCCIFLKSIFSHFLYVSMTVIINTTFVSQGDFNGVTPPCPASVSIWAYMLSLYVVVIHVQTITIITIICWCTLQGYMLINLLF